MYVIIYKDRREVKVMSRYAIMPQEEIMIEEEIANNNGHTANPDTEFFYT